MLTLVHSIIMVVLVLGMMMPSSGLSRAMSNDTYPNSFFNSIFNMQVPLPLPECEKVSAICVVFNEEFTIQESLFSIASFLPEVIVVDHESTDNTSMLVAELMTIFKNIKYVRILQKQYSHGAAKNVALSMSTREWSLRWDADFITYGRTRIRDLCRYTGFNDVGSFSFEIPRVDGDAYHNNHKNARNSPEIYLFRSIFFSFESNKNLDDSPTAKLISGKKPLQRHLFYDYSVINRRYNKRSWALPGGPFMLHFATHKHMEKSFFRRVQTEYTKFVRTWIRYENMQKPIASTEYDVFVRKWGGNLYLQNNSFSTSTLLENRLIELPDYRLWFLIEKMREGYKLPMSRQKVVTLFNNIAIKNICQIPDIFSAHNFSLHGPHSNFLLKTISVRLNRLFWLEKTVNATTFIRHAPGCP